VREGIFERLVKYLGHNFSSFHVPGHKGRISGFDVTELEETDDLYNSNGFIEASENNAADLFGSEFTLFSAGGNALCIQTMLKIFVPCGGKLIIARNVHKSVVNATILLGIEPVWLSVCGNDANLLELAVILKNNNDLSAVFLTSPDYFGNFSNIKAVKEVCGTIPILVDCAHGSHLKFIRGGRFYPLALGASASADSAHKTLPVLTGGAFLHINDRNITKEEAKSAMSLFASTSPSFHILASLDKCVSLLRKKGTIFYKKLQKNVLKIKKIAKKNNFLYKNDDPVRIVFNFSNENKDKILKYFKKHKIMPEFFFDGKMVLIPSIFNRKKDWKRLLKAVRCLKIKKKDVINNEKKYDVPWKKINPREAFFARKEKIETKKSLGRISSDSLCSCPPGIPLVIPGEIIDEGKIKNLLDSGFSYINVKV
jgi:arginine/lysine/ornithine decarboxylase